MLDRILHFKYASRDLNNIQLQTKQNLLAAIANKTIKLTKRDKCICGNKNFEKLTSVDRFGLNFPAFICKHCGLILTNPFISENSLNQYYNEFYHPLTFGTLKPKNNLYSTGQGKKIFLRIKKYLSKKEIKIFEIGAGTGSNLKDFKEEAFLNGLKVQPFGIEFNKEYVNYGNSQGMKLENLSLEDYATNFSNKFDVIILSHVFEHFIDPLKEMEFLKNISHDRSIIYIEVPGILNLKSNVSYNCDILNYLTHSHVFHFSLASLNYTLSLAGFKLMNGNELIEAVFKIDRKTGSANIPKNQMFSIEKNYNEIICYLNDLEQNMYFYKTKIMPRKFLKKLNHLSKKIAEKITQSDK